MKNIQTLGINYIFVILFTVALSWYFISDNNNKLVSAADKSISSVVTISSSTQSSLSYSNNKSGMGSGVIFSKEGYIVTNLHILNSNNINVQLNNGKNYPANIIGIDKNADIAVLKISADENLNPINIADSDNLKIGDKVLAIGNPYGIGISVSNGIVSATGRDYGNPYLQLIQTDAAINPGNSGGALINENGNLIGINSKIFSSTGAYQGIGFAIPSNLVVQIATQLIRFGEVKSLWIGNFRVSRVDLKINDKYSSGLRIVEMEKIGPLFDRGIQINDIITKINDQDSNWNNLIQSLRYATLGESLKLEFYTVSNEFKTYEFKYSGD
ncbi:trypsin-like peptidase domain-containing protein [Gammaproteobacteria bacterium]|nr:trypsin-like peptidase domain-containing protein [Gammaproteobacteria bacterium]